MGSLIRDGRLNAHLAAGGRRIAGSGPNLGVLPPQGAGATSEWRCARINAGLGVGPGRTQHD